MSLVNRGEPAQGKRPSEFHTVWLFVLFDLPVNTQAARTRYARFRKRLLREGFTRLQFSVYARHFLSEEASGTARQRVRRLVPPAGAVRVLSVTDHQFGKMECYEGRAARPVEPAPSQLVLF